MCTFQRTTKAAWFSSRRFVRKDFWYKIGVVINPRLFDFKQAHTWDSADNGLTRRTYVFSFQIFFYVYIIVFCYSRNDIMCSTRNTFIINLRRDYCLTSYLVPFICLFFFACNFIFFATDFITTYVLHILISYIWKEHSCVSYILRSRTLSPAGATTCFGRIFVEFD